MLQFVSYKFMKVKGYIDNMKSQAGGTMSPFFLAPWSTAFKLNPQALNFFTIYIYILKVATFLID